MNAFDRAFLGEESEKTTERAAAIQDTARDTLDEAQGVKEDPFDRVFGAVKEDIPPPKAADEGYSAGTFTKDAGKMAGSAFVSATLKAPKGIEDATKGLVRDVATGDIMDKGPLGMRLLNIARMVFTDAVGIRSLQDQFQDKQDARVAADKALSGFEFDWTKDLAAYGDKVEKDIRASISEQGKQRIQGSTPEGNIFKGELSFGDDPTLSGYALQAAGVLGSLGPTLLTIIATKNPNAAAGVGFGMGAGEASDSARDYIGKLSHDELLANSPYYKQLIDRGLNQDQAKKIVTDKAAESGALLQGMVAAVGDRVTGKLLTGAYDNILGKVVPKGTGVGARTGRAATYGAASAIEEGVQEVTEGVASDIGVASQITNKEIGQDSAANLVLGAIGGAGPGAVRGFITPGEQQTPPPPPAPAQTQQSGQTVDTTVQTVADPAQPADTTTGATDPAATPATLAQTTVDPELNAAAGATFGGEGTAQTADPAVNTVENAGLDAQTAQDAQAQDQNLSLPSDPVLNAVPAEDLVDQEIAVANAQSETVDEEPATTPRVTPDRQLQVNLGASGRRYVVFSDPDHKVLFQLASRVLKSAKAATPQLQKQVNDLTKYVAARFNLPINQVRGFAMDYRDRVIQGAKNVETDGTFTAPTPGTTNPIIDEAVNQINQEFKLAPGETVQIQEANVDTRMSKIAKAIKAAFGTDVVWVNFGPNRTLTTNTGRSFGAVNGMRVGNRNAVLLDAANPKFLNTLGHELTHVLETKYPEIYAKLVELAKTKVPQEKQNKFREALQAAVSAESGEQVDEGLFESELVAEMIGEQAIDPQFWIDVFTASADRNFAQEFLRTLQDIIEKLLNVMQGPQFVRNRKDLLAVRQAATEAFQQWIQQEQTDATNTQGVDSTTQPGQFARALDRGRGKSETDPIVDRDEAYLINQKYPASNKRKGRCHELSVVKVAMEFGDRFTQVLGVAKANPVSRIWHSVVRDPATNNIWEPISDRWYTPEAMDIFGFEPVLEKTAAEVRREASSSGVYPDQGNYKPRGWEQDYMRPGDYDPDYTITGYEPEGDALSQALKMAGEMQRQRTQPAPEPAAPRGEVNAAKDVADTGKLSDAVRNQYPEVARVYDQVMSIIDAAPAVNDMFKSALDRLGEMTGAKVKMGPIKKIDRAFSKVWFEYKGNVDGLNDIVRATLVVDTVEQVQPTVDAALNEFQGSVVKRNLWEDGAEPLEGGYRDVMLRNLVINGMRVELQINVGAMIEAKNEAHQYYKESEEIRRKIDAGLISGPEMAEARATLLQNRRRQADYYQKAYVEANRLRNSASDNGTPSDINAWSPNVRGSGESNAVGSGSSGPNVTGMPSTSKNLVPSANEEGIGTGTPLLSRTLNGIVNQPADSVERSTVWLRESDAPAARQGIGLNPEPAPRGENANRVRQIGEALNALTLRSHGKIDDKDNTDASKEKIAVAMADEIQYHLSQQAKTGTGLGWYSNNFPNAIKRLGKVFPELKRAGGPRDMFTAILAVTSNGEDVLDNTRMAIRIYEQVRNGTRITDVDVGTRRKQALDANLAVIQELVDAYGMGGMRKYLLSEMTVSEINAELRARGEKPNSSYTASMTMPRAALFFGPKLGAFYANLSGAEGYLTMDLWWSRTFNRMRGTLIPQPTQTGIDAVRQLLNLPEDATVDAVVEAAVPYQESYKAKGYKNGTEIEVKSNTLVKSALLELNEAPFRASDREFMYDTAVRAQELLKDRGINLSIADIQAALWYYEKRLYGILSGKKADDIGYEEAIDEYIKSDRSERPPARFSRVDVGGAVATGQGTQTDGDVRTEGADPGPASPGRTLFSRAAIEAVLRNDPDAPTILAIGRTPAVLQTGKVPNDPLVITARTIDKVVNPETRGKNLEDTTYYGNFSARRIPLTIEEMMQIPDMIADPVAVLRSSDRASRAGFVVVLDMEKDGAPVIAAIHDRVKMRVPANRAGNDVQVTEIASVYPKNQTINRGAMRNLSSLNFLFTPENMVYYNEEKAAALATRLRLSLPRLVQSTSSLPKSVSTPQSIVNRYGPNALKLTRFSRQSWNQEPEGDNLVYLLQDKMVDLKRSIRAIIDSGFQLADRWDAYLQEELFHGRAAKRVKDFISRELDPLLKEMVARGVTIDEIDQHLHAKHAKEANAQVRSVNPGLPDGGSGMTDQQADDYLNNLPADKRQLLDSLAARVMQMTAETRRLMVAYGLETQDTIDQWEQAYQNYVPLFREGIESGTLGIGQGFSVKGSESKRRIGSQKSVVDILANIVMQREKVIARGEKNRIGVALFGLAVQNPNESFWLPINPDTTFTPAARSAMIQTLLSMGISQQDADNIAALPQQKVIDSKTGIVTLAPSPTLKSQPNVLTMRINGKDRVLLFNMNDPRATRMVAALKNLDTNNLGQATAMMGKAGTWLEKIAGGFGTATRYFASINTQYNPAFGIYNFMRDVVGGTINLSSTPLRGQRTKVLLNAFPALAGIYRDLRLVRDGKTPTSNWSQVFEEYESEGGKTGFRDLFARADERAKALERELKMIQAGALKKAGMGIMNWLSDFNEAIENAIRLSAYKAAKDQGLSNQRAASLAKNLTVNFNRKGAVTNRAAILYAFFNASVQGTARIGETMLDPNSKKMRLGKVGRNIALGGVGIGIMQAVMLAMAGFDEDDPPEYLRDKSLIIPTGDGKYIAIPMPLGYNVLPAFGRRITEMALKENPNYPKEAIGIMGMIADAFNPLGASNSFTQMVAPTVFDPLVSIDQNRDNFGRMIAREDFNSLDPTPGWTRGKENASAISTGLAYAINWLTGGTDYTPGKVSPTPDQIDYLFGQVFGGVGREAVRITKSIEAMNNDEELATFNIPVVGRLGGNTKERAVQVGRFYENIKQQNLHQREIEGRQKNDEDVADYLSKYPEAELYKQADKVYRSISDLRKAKRAAKENGEDTKPFDEEIVSRMIQFNELVAQAKGR